MNHVALFWFLYHLLEDNYINFSKTIYHSSGEEANIHISVSGLINFYDFYDN